MEKDKKGFIQALSTEEYFEMLDMCFEKALGDMKLDESAFEIFVDIGYLSCTDEGEKQ